LQIVIHVQSKLDASRYPSVWDHCLQQERQIRLPHTDRHIETNCRMPEDLAATSLGTMEADL
jgi:hypothetical protein